MSSGSPSDSESNRSVSPTTQGPAPTPGHGLDRSASNSPQSSHKSGQASRSGSRSGSPQSNRSRSKSGSRSPSAESNKSGHSDGSNGSRKSRSRSAATNRSHGSNRSRSASEGSHRSGSHGSNRSGSARSRSVSPAESQKSAGSPARKSPSRSRSSSPGSNRRSRSGSAASNGSRSRSKSVESNRSKHFGSRSPSHSPQRDKRSRSNTNSPNLQIDEPASPQSDKSGDKRKREGSEEKTAIKKSKIIDTDSEEEVETNKEVDAAAIFGDADDISSEEETREDDQKDIRRVGDSDLENRKSEDEDNHRSDDDRDKRHEEEGGDKENEPEPIPETRIDVEIPKISCDLGKDIHFVKLPNFLSVETRPFDPESYEDEIEEEETLDEEGRARLKLKVENTIRWREEVDKEGSVHKQSNARLVKWSDGSYSLHLGSEIFDVYKQPLQGDHNHLFIRQGTGLQGQAVFRTKLSFRPHSTESFTHRKMTLSLADRSQKTSGIKILSQVGADPDHDRKTLLKKEEEKLRQTVRVSKPRKKDISRSHGASYREDEGSDEEGAISLNAIKNKYKSGAALTAKGGAIYSSDEEGSDIESRSTRKQDKAKVLKDSDSGESD